MTDEAGEAAQREMRRIDEMCAIDAQLAAARPDDRVEQLLARPDATSVELLAILADSYAGRTALGHRASDAVTDRATGRTTMRLLPRFDTITYAELWTRVQAVAAEFWHDARDPVRTGDVVATLGFTSADYTVVDLGSLLLGAVIVPLPTGSTVAAVSPIVAETRPKVLAASLENLAAAIELALDNPSIRRVVVFDYHPEADDQRERFTAAHVRLADSGSDVVITSLATVITRGLAAPPAPRAVVAPDSDPLALLCYTSGSTGTPKGAMYTDRLLAALWRARLRPPGMPIISVNFLPMSHIAGRYILMSTLATGGTAYFVAKSDLSTLFEDMALVRPTEFAAVPRIWETLFQRHQAELDRGAATEVELKTNLRDRLFGGRILWTLFASAPMSAELVAFAESVLGIPVHDGYGVTEAAVVLLNGKAVPAVSDHKLVDVPELGYYSTDTPYPRGELLFRSATQISGYYQRPELTAQVIDEDGFYRTGDIMAEVEPGTYQYIDRRNNVLKLSHGEFVAVARLEALFAASPAVAQIYVYGNSARAYLLAVVVPTPETVARAGGDLGAVDSIVRVALRQVGAEAGLNSYEIPRGVIIETDPFSTANGLLSGARKLLRPKAKEYYGERLEQLYSELAAREIDELEQLRSSGADGPVVDTVVRAARAVLGSAATDVTPDRHFLELGGDSLSALSFATLLGRIFDIEVTVGDVVSPANDLAAVAARIERALHAGANRPTFASVHGPGSDKVNAADLTLDKFIDAETLAGATTLASPSGAVRTVLVTGATGYLGRFLCLEWLERVAPMDGTVVCLVRGVSPDAACERLVTAFDSGDPELLRRFRELARDHLLVVAGDIGEPALGLDATTWQWLAETVDLVVHPGALVNHVLPYEQLFGPNVAGTAEVIRLASSVKLKPVTYLSTVAVLPGAASADERSDIRQSSPTRVLDEEYANGYVASKWAAEVLLREAHDAYGLPVTVLRSDMILAHSTYRGQLNVSDLFTRLLLSLLVTGIAPRSFYDADAPAHYDGLPVDFTAAAVATVGAQVDGHRTYNLLNPHEDGISLDTCVDWLIEAGHPIVRLDDYDEWYARFTTAIRGLPEQQQHSSILPLLHAFREPAHPTPGAEFPTDVFRAAIGPAIDIPHVTRALIEKYVDDLDHLGLRGHRPPA